MKELAEYIRQSRTAGTTAEQINKNLVQAGWSQSQIDESWKQVNEPVVATSAASATTAPLPGSTAPELSVKASHHNKEKYLAVGGAIVILLAGGYFAYAKYYNTPDKIWESATRKTRDLASGHITLEGSYTDKALETGEDEENSDSLFGGFGDITVSMKADGDFKTRGEDDADLDLKSTFGMKLGAFNVSVDVETRKVGDNLFYKIGDNPLAELFGAGVGGNKNKSEWLKIDLKRQDETDNPFFNISEQQIKQLTEAFDQAKIIKPGKLLGSEKIADQNTYHFEAKIDKDEIRRYIETLMNVVNEGFMGTLTESEKTELKDAINRIVDKIEVRKMEVWIGKSDRRIHQFLIETTAPSVINQSLEVAKEQSRDAKRIADVRQIMTAAELYFNDCGTYPPGDKVVLDGEGLAGCDGWAATPSGTLYMQATSPAPTPIDGNCTEAQNSYAYTQLDNGNDYSITFCLGAATGGLMAGPNEATPMGLSYTSSELPVEDGSSEFDRFIASPFTGTLNVKVNLSNFNSSVNIEEPADALDYFMLQDNQDDLNNAESTLAYGLDSYFRENQRYPDRLGQLLEKTEWGGSYIYTSDDKLPKPKNTEGDCSGINEFWNYFPTNDGQDFVLEYCLTEDTEHWNGDKPRGKHKVTAATNNTYDY